MCAGNGLSKLHSFNNNNYYDDDDDYNYVLLADYKDISPVPNSFDGYKDVAPALVSEGLYLNSEHDYTPPRPPRPKGMNKLNQQYLPYKPQAGALNQVASESESVPTRRITLYNNLLEKVPSIDRSNDMNNDHLASQNQYSRLMGRPTTLHQR